MASLAELLEQGLIFERDALELEDEMTAEQLAQLPNLPVPRSQTAQQRTRDESEIRPTALMSGPLAFDS